MCLIQLVPNPPFQSLWGLGSGCQLTQRIGLFLLYVIFIFLWIYLIFLEVIIACVMCTYSSICHKCSNDGLSFPCLFHGKAFAVTELRKRFWIKGQVDLKGSKVICYVAGHKDHMSLSIPKGGSQPCSRYTAGPSKDGHSFTAQSNHYWH